MPPSRTLLSLILLGSFLVTVISSTLPTGQIEFSETRGYKNLSFVLNITSNNREIYYIRCGAQHSGSCPSPNLTNSEPFPNSGIQINTTTVIRAIGVRNGVIETAPETHSYVYLDDVIRQPADSPGWPTGLLQVTTYPAPNNPYVAKFDTEMDPEIVDSSEYKHQMHASLRALPAMLLSFDSDLFLPDYFYVDRF